jgi:hypothetical protein
MRFLTRVSRGDLRLNRIEAFSDGVDQLDKSLLLEALLLTRRSVGG